MGRTPHLGNHWVNHWFLSPIVDLCKQQCVVVVVVFPQARQLTLKSDVVASKVAVTVRKLLLLALLVLAMVVRSLASLCR